MKRLAILRRDWHIPDDWVCPECGAAKSDFALATEAAA